MTSEDIIEGDFHIGLYLHMGVPSGNFCKRILLARTVGGVFQHLEGRSTTVVTVEDSSPERNPYILRKKTERRNY